MFFLSPLLRFYTKYFTKYVTIKRYLFIGDLLYNNKKQDKGFLLIIYSRRCNRFIIFQNNHLFKSMHLIKNYTFVQIMRIYCLAVFPSSYALLNLAVRILLFVLSSRFIYSFSFYCLNFTQFVMHKLYSYIFIYNTNIDVFLNANCFSFIYKTSDY